MQCFITHASLRNGGNSFFSFILQDSHYACLIKLESFDLGILCNSLPMNHITTPKPRGQSFKYRWVQFKEAFSGPSSVKGDSVSEQAHSRVQ